MPNRKPTGYRLALSAGQTWLWANKPGRVWLCSEVAGRTLHVEVDANGLCYLEIDGRSDTDVPANELAAIVDDHMPADCRHLWPAWGNPPHEQQRNAAS